MGRRPKILDPTKSYKAGDQIHISITQDYVDTATEFFRLCTKYHYSPSEVIRGNISEWVEETKKMFEQYEQAKKIVMPLEGEKASET